MVVDVLNSTRKEVVKWVKSCLSTHRIRLRKRLSQVVLVEPSAYRKVVEVVKQSLGSRPGTVVEVGAGLGTLTAALGTIQNAYVIALEIDDRFAPILKDVQDECYGVDIVIGDARQLLTALRAIDGVVGNLPYHITSDLILAIGRTNASFSVVTVQKDVAERLTAPPGTKSYGKISLFAQYLFDVGLVEVLPQHAFLPPPEVLSAIVLLKRKRPYTSYSNLEKLVKCLFSFKRRHVLKSLKKCLGVEAQQIITTVSDEVWRKRVYQLAPEDIEKLATVLKELSQKRVG